MLSTVKAFFRPRPITPESAKSVILSLPESQKMSILSEMVRAATAGKAHIHRAPYALHPREDRSFANLP